MKKVFKNQFLIAVFAYLLVIGLATFPLVKYLQKIKIANEKYREKLTTYLNWRFDKNRNIQNLSKITCAGDLFFQADNPIASMEVHENQLYLSQQNGKLTVVNLENPTIFSQYNNNLYADLYSDSTELFAAEMLNDKVVSLSLNEGKIHIVKIFWRNFLPSSEIPFLRFDYIIANSTPKPSQWIKTVDLLRN